MMTIQSLDAQLLLLINHGTANPLFDVLMPALSAKGYLLVLPFLLYLVLSSIDGKNTPEKKYLPLAISTVVICCFAVFLAAWAVDELKSIAERERPCRTIEGIRLITSCPQSWSMPSSHAATSFAFVAPILFLIGNRITRFWRLFLLVLATLVAFSRMYMGVHYPTDVLAGALLGTAIGMALSIVGLMVVTRCCKGEK